MNIKILMGMSSYFLSTLPLFSLCREIPHPTAGGALLHPTPQASLRAKRESVFLSKGLISKPLVRLFYWQTTGQPKRGGGNKKSSIFVL